MENEVLAQFTATDGSGVWSVTPTGICVGGQLYHFTDRSHIVQCGLPGRAERHVMYVEEEDPTDTALFQALAVYWETGSWSDAGLALWALNSFSAGDMRIESNEIPGNVQLSVGGLARGRDRDLSLRYREDGRCVQIDAIQRFADATLVAISAYRNRPKPKVSRQ